MKLTMNSQSPIHKAIMLIARAFAGEFIFNGPQDVDVGLDRFHVALNFPAKKEFGTLHLHFKRSMGSLKRIFRNKAACEYGTKVTQGCVIDFIPFFKKLMLQALAVRVPLLPSDIAHDDPNEFQNSHMGIIESLHGMINIEGRSFSEA